MKIPVVRSVVVGAAKGQAHAQTPFMQYAGSRSSGNVRAGASKKHTGRIAPISVIWRDSSFARKRPLRAGLRRCHHCATCRVIVVICLTLPFRAAPCTKKCCVGFCAGQPPSTGRDFDHAHAHLPQQIAGRLAPRERRPSLGCSARHSTPRGLKVDFPRLSSTLDSDHDLKDL